MATLRGPIAGLVVGNNMSFLVYKLLGTFVMPSNAIALFALAGGVAPALRLPRFGRLLTWTAALALLLCGFGPVGAILMRPLEDRFPQPPADMPEPAGIIVLGGAISPLISATRNHIALTQDGERLTEAAALALRYPNAMLVFSGGSVTPVPDAVSEATAAKKFFADFGIAESRIVIENRSRNTAENATFTRNLIAPQADQRWLLVTSASHMPRAVGSFRRAGLAVIPYPVGYTTTGLPGDFSEIRLEVSTNLVRLDVAVREWIGLVVYWLTGVTDALLPGSDGG